MYIQARVSDNKYSDDVVFDKTKSRILFLIWPWDYKIEFFFHQYINIYTT